MTHTHRISGKNLGALALPSFCPRCFWIKRHASDGVPYQVFPGIFSSIDAFSEVLVKATPLIFTGLAVAAAAVRSGISEYSVNTLVPSLSWWDRLLYQIGAETRSWLQKSSIYRSLIKSVEPALTALQTFLIFPDPNGMYAHWMINYFE